eukprot:scaffold74576_cov51-Prasinocladus_malaysianus.AAC.1
MVFTNYTDFKLCKPGIELPTSSSQSSAPFTSSSDCSLASTDVAALMELVPASWKKGSVSGYSDAHGCFELVEDS